MELGSRFGILGGDRRQLYLAQALARDGHTVYVCGFEGDLLPQGVKTAGLEELLQGCSVMVLPVPVTRDGVHLNMPYSKGKIVLDDCFAARMAGKQVFCGGAQRLRNSSALWEQMALFDYTEQELFAVQNAVPTAEGAVMMAMELSPKTVHGAMCLVVGYGRIGKALCRMLRALGAQVTVSARNSGDLAWIAAQGCKAVRTEEMESLGEAYDVIFNTVPAVVVREKLLAKQGTETLLMELASVPGGFDREAAAKLGRKIVPALGLPGKVAPHTAGVIIQNTIYEMMRSETL